MMHPALRSGVPDWWETSLRQAEGELGVTCRCGDCPDCWAVNARAMAIHDEGPPSPEDLGEPEDRSDR